MVDALQLCDTPTDAIYDAAIEAVTKLAAVPSWIVVVGVNAALLALKEEATGKPPTYQCSRCQDTGWFVGVIIDAEDMRGKRCPYCSRGHVGRNDHRHYDPGPL